MAGKSQKQKKIATQMDETVLKELRAYVESADRSISSVITEAVTEFLDRTKVRPAFRTAMDEVLRDHADVLQRLAK